VRQAVLTLTMTGLMIMVPGTAHANAGPMIGVFFLGVILALPALVALIIWLSSSSKETRNTAGILLLAMIVLFGSCAVFSMTVGTTRHETWQWHTARAYMELITDALSSYAPIYETAPYPVGELNYRQLIELIPSGYNFPPSPDDAFFNGFRYHSANGVTYRIETEVHTRRSTWLYATPQGIGPDEPGPRPYVAPEPAHVSKTIPAFSSTVILSPDIAAAWKAVVLEVTDRFSRKITHHTATIGDTVRLGDTGPIVYVEVFLPSFQSKEGIIISSSPDLNNPAAKVRIMDKYGTELYNNWLFALYPAAHPFENNNYEIVLRDFLRNVN
jgi:hypothetical protein